MSLAAALACSGTVGAQATSCALTDHVCIQEEYPKVCFDAGSKLLLESCWSWLREIERSPSHDVRSAAAGIYGLIADNAAAGDVRSELRARAAELILRILDENPRHPDALLGFAGLAETNEERVRRLRDVVAADPGHVRYLEFLATALESIDGGMLEAAAVYERAYEVELSRAKGDYTWRFARNALWAYDRADSPERAARFRERVANDFGLPAMRRTVANAATPDAASLGRILQDFCREMTLALFGGKPCVESIDQVVAALDRDLVADRARRLELQRAVSAAMFTAARSGFQLDAVDSGWRRRFEAILDRYDGVDAAARLRETESVITVE